MEFEFNWPYDFEKIYLQSNKSSLGLKVNPLVLEKNFFLSFDLIWAWQPFMSCGHTYFI